MSKVSLELILPEDFGYEEETLRNPTSVKTWLFYLAHKQESPKEHSFQIFERALQHLPGSYKLWQMYIQLRLSLVFDFEKFDKESCLYKRILPVWSDEYSYIYSCYIRALNLCSKHPLMWIGLCRFLMHLPYPTLTRRTFNNALKSLPITQHYMIWDLFLKYTKNISRGDGVGESVVRIWRRYLRFAGLDSAEDYLEVLLGDFDEDLGEDIDEDDENVPEVEESTAEVETIDIKHTKQRYAEAARVLSIIISDPKYVSKKGRSNFQIWQLLSSLASKYASELSVRTSDALFGSISDSKQNTAKGLGIINTLDIEPLLRAGVSKFTDQVAKLWISLATYHTSLGNFDAARDIFEEAITCVKTVRDFTIVYDSYCEFEEAVCLELIKDESESNVEVDMRLERLERLIDRRPVLVSNVLLRQNPHNCTEWERRASVYKTRGDLQKVVDTYTDAIKTIHPKKSSGKFNVIWNNFATFYESQGDLENARQIFQRGVSVGFKTVNELADLWIQWAEMELRHDEFQNAIDVMVQATSPPPLSKKYPSHASIQYKDEEIPPQIRIFKSLKVWSFYVDIEEAIGTVESTKLVYQRIMELKIATPQIIINCATFLEQNKYFEESYKAYERGIEMFGYPIAFDFWNLYLEKFVSRYGGSKLERCRDLFEHAVEKCPPKFCKPLYLMYAKLEEDYGLARHAMKIYDRATKCVSDADRAQMYSIYISKSVSIFGQTSAREIYQRAIETLPDKFAKDMALKYAQMETLVYEIDRARAVYAYGSQFANPKIESEYWKEWQEFETKHGNEDTFKEMLRIKRSVSQKYNNDVVLMASASLGGSGDVVEVVDPVEALLNPMATLEKQAESQPKASGSTRVVGFVPAKDRITLEGNMPEVEEKKVPSEEEVGIEKREIPAGVFGGLKDK